eukprot:5965658-Alexandrium_andersonii.AAC.1
MASHKTPDLSYAVMAVRHAQRVHDWAIAIAAAFCYCPFVARPSGVRQPTTTKQRQHSGVHCRAKVPSLPAYNETPHVGLHLSPSRRQLSGHLGARSM